MKKDFIVCRSITEIEGKPHVETYSEQELIRCKDCKHGKSRKNAKDEDMIDCLLADNWLKNPDWFCADGERKEGR